MTKADLYEVTLKSADSTQKTDDFLADQRKITSGVKRHIKEALKKEGLSAEFAFADKKIPGYARVFQIYATPQAIEVINHVPDVKSTKRMTASMHLLTRDI